MARSIKVESKDFRRVNLGMCRFDVLGTTCDCLELILDSIGNTPEGDTDDSDLGDKFDLTRERVRQIKEKAIRRLRQHSRSRLLKMYLGE